MDGIIHVILFNDIDRIIKHYKFVKVQIFQLFLKI